MADSTSKKEKNKKKALKRLEKISKREDRKENNNKGKSLEEMIVYVDVLGNFTDVPPHLQDKEGDLLKNDRKVEKDAFIEGVVDNYNESKGFGFIKVPNSNDKIFFHFKESRELLKVGDQVQFKKAISEKGFRATQITKK
ncbi:Cold shock protein, CspA family [Chishuiella changwenlii]|jgi:cold shock CspA family protein|uniref:Cold shock protein, CspA family n=1 Tax=Chishuiella changwenlii TaxID=1434701 RepID=A0A1M7CNM6_9FLAO|nr:cold shock domain-containing protein [Chishuiella changwenlii]GGF09623.1 cold-shock protein [Chishuiella changwenlii]SHL68908.1 Cold shock protein, CspA family [Chishuiella changwenlii]